MICPCENNKPMTQVPCSECGLAICRGCLENGEELHRIDPHEPLAQNPMCSACFDRLFAARRIP